MKRIGRTAACLAVVALLTAGCMRQGSEGLTWRLADSSGSLPALPERLEIGAEGVPMLRVYGASGETTEAMDVERYVAGVVAGEMRNDWPAEALKAQAILARTFTLKYCAENKSKHAGADISADVSEAQAYAPDSVNERVRQAVADTRGQALVYDGEYVNAWFHAHAGGMTELPSVALEYPGDDPAYLKPTASGENDAAPENAREWTATFTQVQVAKACADAGAKVGAADSVGIGERGESGRAKTLLVDGVSVSAPSFRIQIGANRLRSTLIDDIRVDGDTVTFTGRGFGHGVGMSQWGAYAMAMDGEDAAGIVRRYFPGAQIVKLW